MTKYITSLSNCIKYFKNVIFYNLKKERLERVDMKTPHESSWTPLLWAMKLLARAKADQKISIEPPSYTNLLASFEKVENVNRKLLRYSWINFPLAYTQVRYISTICIITHKILFYSFLFYIKFAFIHLGRKPCCTYIFCCRTIQPSIFHSGLKWPQLLLCFSQLNSYLWSKSSLQ